MSLSFHMNPVTVLSGELDLKKRLNGQSNRSESCHSSPSSVNELGISAWPRAANYRSLLQLRARGTVRRQARRHPLFPSSEANTVVPLFLNPRLHRCPREPTGRSSRVAPSGDFARLVTQSIWSSDWCLPCTIGAARQKSVGSSVGGRYSCPCLFT